MILLDLIVENVLKQEKDKTQTVKHISLFEKCKGCSRRMLVGIFCKDCAESLAIWVYTNQIKKTDLEKLIDYYKKKKC